MDLKESQDLKRQFQLKYASDLDGGIANKTKISHSLYN